MAVQAKRRQTTPGNHHIGRGEAHVSEVDLAGPEDQNSGDSHSVVNASPEVREIFLQIIQRAMVQRPFPAAGNTEEIDVPTPK